MAATYSPVAKNAEDVRALANLAGDIWREYWPALIGTDQTEYMIEKFQSFEAIMRDTAEHDYEYWFVCSSQGGCDMADENAPDDDPRRHVVGFTGGRVEPETNRFFISKVYLLSDERGKHYASDIIGFYNSLCKARGLDAMYLTVNKYNDLGTRAYRGKGFEVIDVAETDIGSGFIMDDYIMERKTQ